MALSNRRDQTQLFVIPISFVLESAWLLLHEDLLKALLDYHADCNQRSGSAAGLSAA